MQRRNLVSCLNKSVDLVCFGSKQGLALRAAANLGVFLPRVLLERYGRSRRGDDRYLLCLLMTYASPALAELSDQTLRRVPCTITSAFPCADFNTLSRTLRTFSDLAL